MLLSGFCSWYSTFTKNIRIMTRLRQQGISFSLLPTRLRSILTLSYHILLVDFYGFPLKLLCICFVFHILIWFPAHRSLLEVKIKTISCDLYECKLFNDALNHGRRERWMTMGQKSKCSDTNLSQSHFSTENQSRIDLRSTSSLRGD